MTTPRVPSSDDFFHNMGAASPPQAPKQRPRANLARPPPPKPVPAGGSTGAPTIGGVNAKPKPVPPPAAARPRPTAAPGSAGGAVPSSPSPAGRTGPATAPTQRRPAGRGATTGSTAAAGRQPTASGAGRTATAGRGNLSGRTRTARPASRPTTSGTGAGPAGGTGFYGTSASTHLGTSSSNNNPYAGGASSNPYARQTPQQQPQVHQSNDPFMQTPSPQVNNSQQWQQPSTMQPVSNVQQWQQQSSPMQMQPDQSAQQQPQQQQNMGGNFFLSGVMSSGSTTDNDPSGKNTASSSSATNTTYGDDIGNEPPLLEELGINLDHIWAKTKAVILPYRKLTGDTIHMDPSMIVEDADLAGPLAFALALGGELLLTGKFHFGYIYGFSFFGCLSMTLVINLMTPHDAVSVWTVASILGYSLLPVNILALVKILVVNIIRLETFGRILALMAVIWSTMASTRLLEVGCGMRDQRYLIGYPIALLYSAFVLLTIF